jgi:hypothetical protein
VPRYAKCTDAFACSPRCHNFRWDLHLAINNQIDPSLPAFKNLLRGSITWELSISTYLTALTAPTQSPQPITTKVNNNPRTHLRNRETSTARAIPATPQSAYPQIQLNGNLKKPQRRHVRRNTRSTPPLHIASISLIADGNAHAARTRSPG